MHQEGVSYAQTTTAMHAGGHLQRINYNQMAKQRLYLPSCTATEGTGGTWEVYADEESSRISFNVERTSLDDRAIDIIEVEACKRSR